MSTDAAYRIRGFLILFKYLHF